MSRETIGKNRWCEAVDEDTLDNTLRPAPLATSTTAWHNSRSRKQHTSIFCTDRATLLQFAQFELHVHGKVLSCRPCFEDQVSSLKQDKIAAHVGIRLTCCQPQIGISGIIRGQIGQLVSWPCGPIPNHRQVFCWRFSEVRWFWLWPQKYAYVCATPGLGQA